MYIFTNELTERGKNHMQKKNVVFTKEGMKVGVKELKNEDYEDKTQRFGFALLLARPLAGSRRDQNSVLTRLLRSYLVKMWNTTSFPNYKSKLWNTVATDENENG